MTLLATSDINVVVLPVSYVHGQVLFTPFFLKEKVYIGRNLILRACQKI
jgi:hypothetical protein